MPLQPTLSLRLRASQAGFEELQTDRHHYQTGAPEAVQSIVQQRLFGEPHSVVATQDRQRDDLGIVSGPRESQGAKRCLPRLLC